VRRITGRCGLRVGVSNAASHGKYQRHKQAVHAKTKHGVTEDQTFSLVSDKSQHVRIGLVTRHCCAIDAISLLNGTGNYFGEAGNSGAGTGNFTSQNRNQR
jgi:hypothetical protein